MRKGLIGWGIITLLYLGFLKIPISRAYIDFGDGNYQYIAWRMTQGVSLYTDILSPQPPFHLLFGRLLVDAGDLVGIDSLLLFRWSIHLIRAGISLGVFFLSWRLWENAWMACLSAGVFYFLPEGYRWSGGYESEHLEILFLTFGVLGCASGKVWSCSLGACLAVGALWTNLSSLPYALLIFWLSGISSANKWAPPAIGAATAALFFGLSYLYAGQAYLENVWSSQVASIPASPSAWLASLSEQGTAIISLEGLWILLALLGIWRFLRSSSTQVERLAPLQRGLLGLYGIASIGSAVYVIKGGTVDYIFSIAEPMIALFSGMALVKWFSSGIDAIREEMSILGRALTSSCRILLLAGLIALLAWQPIRLAQGIRTQSGPGVDLPDVSEGRIIEFSDHEVRTLERIIAHLVSPGDLIWAPPFLAALTHHPIPMDLSETFLWWVRWHQSMGGRMPDEGVDRMLREMTGLFERREAKALVINDRTGQWGQLLVPGRQLQGMPLRRLDARIEALQAAIEINYHPILEAPGSDQKLYFQGWNERLEFWVPKDQPALLPPWLLQSPPVRREPGP